MRQNRVFSRRAGVLPMIVAALGVASLGTLATISFRSAVPPTGTGGGGGGRAGGGAGVGGGGSAPSAVRPAEPQEIGAILHMIGLEPECLAAAGLSGQQCDAVFDAGTVYCMQADRTDQFRLAFRALNLAQARSVRPPVEGDANLPTVAQAQVALDNVKNDAFNFVTTDLSSGTVAKLTKMRTNAHWGLAAPYLLGNHTDAEWLALRGALGAQRYATRTGTELAQVPAAVIADAEGNQDVAAAKTALASGLTAIQQSWSSHEHPNGP